MWALPKALHNLGLTGVVFVTCQPPLPVPKQMHPWGGVTAERRGLVGIVHTSWKLLSTLPIRVHGICHFLCLWFHWIGQRGKFLHPKDTGKKWSEQTQEHPDLKDGNYRFQGLPSSWGSPLNQHIKWLFCSAKTRTNWAKLILESPSQN